jgi:hypothetical protein
MNDLEEKGWYRAIKVLYFAVYIIVALIAIFLLTSGGVCGGQWSNGSWIYNQCSFITWLITLLIIAGVFELIKRIFLYIVTGKSKG